MTRRKVIPLLLTVKWRDLQRKVPADGRTIRWSGTHQRTDADVNADMAGTWPLVGGKVFSRETADTFVRDMDFVPSQDRLSRDHTFTDRTRVRVVLTK